MSQIDFTTPNPFAVLAETAPKSKPLVKLQPGTSAYFFNYIHRGWSGYTDRDLKYLNPDDSSWSDCEDDFIC